MTILTSFYFIKCQEHIDDMSLYKVQHTGIYTYNIGIYNAGDLYNK